MLKQPAVGRMNCNGMACRGERCQLVVRPVSEHSQIELAQSGPRVERARKVAAAGGCRIDLQCLGREGGRAASSGFLGKHWGLRVV